MEQAGRWLILFTTQSCATKNKRLNIHGTSNLTCQWLLFDFWKGQKAPSMWTELTFLISRRALPKNLSHQKSTARDEVDCATADYFFPRMCRRWVRLLLFACGSALPDLTACHPSRYPTHAHKKCAHTTRDVAHREGGRQWSPSKAFSAHLHNNRSSHAGHSEEKYEGEKKKGGGGGANLCALFKIWRWVNKNCNILNVRKYGFMSVH